MSLGEKRKAHGTPSFAEAAAKVIAQNITLSKLLRQLALTPRPTASEAASETGRKSVPTSRAMS